MSDVAFTAPLNLLQAFRLTHAICETGLRVHVPETETGKLAALREVFGIEIGAGVDGVPEVTDIEIDHERPLTRVGTVSRPLIFPHGMLARCRDLWAPRRSVGVSFCGLITSSRRASIERWVGGTLQEVHLRGADDGRMRMVFRSRGLPRRRIEVWSSLRGRSYPVKGWDEDYFRLLCRSRFVLCPPGDFTWTYRFFEAVLCGAIPVVEEPAEVYDGFGYRTMDVPPNRLRYDPAVVDANHRLAAERLTVPLEQLRDAVLAARTRA